MSAPHGTEPRLNGTPTAFAETDAMLARLLSEHQDAPSTGHCSPSTEQAGSARHAPSSAGEHRAPGTEHTPAHLLTEQPERRHMLSYVPPVAALGAAFCLQVIAVTDLLGGSLSTQLGNWGYLLGALFGLAVASAAEGGAALLMSLYEKHLLARDSTLTLRIGMVGYVCASAIALHWWAAHRGLPVIVSWLLAGMSASALFLWAQESRWKHRKQMRQRGLMDPALPRMSTGAKVWHPIKYLITMHLITWDQAASTQEARARYAAWRTGRSGRSGAQPIRAQASTAGAEHAISAPSSEQAMAQPIEVSTEQAAITAQASTAADQGAGSSEQPEHQHTEQVSTEQRTTRTRRISVTEEITEQVSTKASIEDLAHTLDRAFPDRVPGRPSALPVLRSEHGSCSEPRAKEAITLLAQWREQAQ